MAHDDYNAGFLDRARIESLMVGRHSETRQLMTALEGSNQRVVSLTGPRGAGKTLLARCVAARYMEATGLRVVYEWADRLPWLSHLRMPDEVSEWEQAWRLLRERVRQQKADVLMLDGIDQLGGHVEDHVDQLLATSEVRVVVLITCQQPSERLQTFQIALGPMKQVEIEQFLAARLEEGSAPPKTDVSRVASLCGGNPRTALYLAHSIASGRSAEDALADLNLTLWAVDNAADGPGDAPALAEATRGIEHISNNLAALIARRPELMNQLDPYEFEQLVAELYARQGFSVELTQKSSDGGVDLYAVKFMPFGRLLTVVDCKRYTPPRKVGVGLVRQLYGTVQDKQASAGVIATTSFFTRGAEDLQRRYPFRIGLQDLDALQRMLSETYKPQAATALRDGLGPAAY